MPRRRDKLLDELRALKQVSGTEPGDRDRLTAALRGAAPLVESAANRITERSITGLDGELVAALERLLGEPAKQDPGCRAKTAVVGALLALHHPHVEPYLRAIAHTQREGGPVPIDTATALRTRAALGLVDLRHAATPLYLADLLVHDEVASRTGAIEAIAAWGDPVLGSALLRVRLAAEHDDDVVAEGMEALMALDPSPGPEGNLDWVVRRLFGGRPSVAESAAIALGASRQDSVLEPLERWVQAQARARDRRIGFVAIGLVRSDAAVDVLLRWLADGADEDARSAAEALEVYRGDPRVTGRVRAVAARAGRAWLFEEWS